MNFSHIHLCIFIPVSQQRLVTFICVYLYLSANRDYITTASQFIFRPTTGQQIQCADITIIDDSIFERKETLLVVLSSPTQGVQPDPQYAFITILDNDGMLCIIEASVCIKINIK